MMYMKTALLGFVALGLTASLTACPGPYAEARENLEALRENPILTEEQQDTLRTFAEERQASRDEQDRPMRGERRERLQQLAGDLALTDDQRAALRDTFAAWKEFVRPTLASVADARTVLADAVLAEPADEETIRAAADALGEAIGDAAVQASMIVEDARAILTPEQEAVLLAFREETIAGRQARIDSALERVDAVMTLWASLNLTPEQIDDLQQVRQTFMENRAERSEGREPRRAFRFLDRFQDRFDEGEEETAEE